MASWAGFAWLWVIQFTEHLPALWVAELIGIGATLATFTVLTLGWIRWNRNIYRRRHRRRVPLIAPVDFARDTQGRRIAAHPGLQRRQGEIVISLNPGLDVKRYSLVGEGPGGHALHVASAS